MRHLETSAERGPFHLHRNRLDNPGDSTELHFHRWAHIVQSGFPLIIRWIEQATGKSIEQRCEVDPQLRTIDPPVLFAGVKHTVEAIEPNTVFTCTFSLWQPDEDGVPFRVGDPKETL